MTDEYIIGLSIAGFAILFGIVICGPFLAIKCLLKYENHQRNMKIIQLRKKVYFNFKSFHRSWFFDSNEQ